MKDKLLKHKIQSKRKIAIFADAHGLLEPTLAILEDARKKGIKEIYSLGDNVGTGPNPSEVMHLLNEYNVKSVKGNHEMYASGELQKLKKHLKFTYSYDETKRVSEWTKNNLTLNEINKLRNLPKKIEIELGGEKILLCHSTIDYNNGKQAFETDKYHEVFEGHTHFEEERNNITTVRGAGIGSKDGESDLAYYIVLSENENGISYTKEIIKVPFNKLELKHMINESTLNNEDKSKISGWIM